MCYIVFNTLPQCVEDAATMCYIVTLLHCYIVSNTLPRCVEDAATMCYIATLLHCYIVFNTLPRCDKNCSRCRHHVLHYVQGTAKTCYVRFFETPPQCIILHWRYHNSVLQCVQSVFECSHSLVLYCTPPQSICMSSVYSSVVYCVADRGASRLDLPTCPSPITTTISLLGLAMRHFFPMHIDAYRCANPHFCIYLRK